MNDTGKKLIDLTSDEKEIKEKLMEYITIKNYPFNQIKTLIKEDIQELVWEDVKDEAE